MDPATEKRDQSPQQKETGSEKTEGGNAIYDVESRTSNSKLNAVFENPLARVSREQLMADVERFCEKYNLMDHVDVFKKGALVSQNPDAAMDLPELDEDDREALRRETTHKWSQPAALYHLTSQSTFNDFGDCYMLMQGF